MKKRKNKTKKEKTILCPFCKKRRIIKGVICRCEVQDTGTEEFWKY